MRNILDNDYPFEYFMEDIKCSLGFLKNNLLFEKFYELCYKDGAWHEMCRINKKLLKTDTKKTNAYFYKEYIFEANIIERINYDKNNIKQ